MKTFHTIFTTVFAVLAAMALGAILFCKAFHQLPIMLGCAAMAIMLYNTRNEEENNIHND